MTLWSWLFVLVVVSGWIIGGIWFQRWAKLHIANGDEKTRREFKRRRARLTGITSLIAGGMFVVAMAITWPTIPRETSRSLRCSCCSGLRSFSTVRIDSSAYAMMILDRESDVGRSKTS